MHERLRHHILSKTAPNIVAIVHIIWTAFMIFGTFYIFFDEEYVFTHLLVISGNLMLLSVLGFCPLTRLEEKLRRLRNPKFTFNNSFLTVYLNKFFKMNLSVKSVDRAITISFIVSYLVSILVLVY